MSVSTTSLVDSAMDTPTPSAPPPAYTRQEPSPPAYGFTSPYRSSSNPPIGNRNIYDWDPVRRDLVQIPAAESAATHEAARAVIARNTRSGSRTVRFANEVVLIPRDGVSARSTAPRAYSPYSYNGGSGALARPQPSPWIRDPRHRVPLPDLQDAELAVRHDEEAAVPHVDGTPDQSVAGRRSRKDKTACYGVCGFILALVILCILVVEYVKVPDVRGPSGVGSA